MSRIRSVLQQRADRFRSKQVQRKQMRGQQRYPLSSAYDDDTDFMQDFTKPQMEPDGANSGYKYTLETTETHATAVETFSSGEENTSYSGEIEQTTFEENYENTKFTEDDGGFLNLAYEASRQEKNSSGGHELIDLVQESRYEEDGADAQPETIEFVDSEDGKVFNITKEVAPNHVGILQNVRSLDDTNTLENDECSKTLNTNTETLQSMPSLNDDDVAHMQYSNRFHNLNVDIRDEAETYEEGELEPNSAYENGDYVEEGMPTQGDTQLYDCDDGEMYQGNGYAEEGVQFEDENYFEQLRNVQSRQVNYYETDPVAMGMVNEEVQAEQWRSVNEQIHYENLQSSHLPVPPSPQLEDPYLSDGNSSWEEGSFATGASRTLSRVDSADDDDVGTRDGNLGGREYYSVDETYAERKEDRPVVKMLKKLRAMNVGDDQSRGGSSDEEDDRDYEDKKTRSKKKHGRRTMKMKDAGVWIMDSIRDIGTDILDETIDYAESLDRPSDRGDGRNLGGTVMDSFAELFSCGGDTSQY